MPRLRALLLCQTLMTLQGPYETAGYYVMEGDNCGWIKKWCQNYLGVLFTFTFLTVRGSGFRNLGKICLWNHESRKILLVKSGILGFGIRNPTNDWNQESRFHWQKLESSTWNLESGIRGRIQECLWFPWMEWFTCLVIGYEGSLEGQWSGFYTWTSPS